MKPLALLSLAFSLTCACGASRDPNDDNLADASGGDDGTSTFDVGGDVTEFDLGSDDVEIGDTACAAVSNTAKEVPLDLFVMLDQSGSMSEKTAAGTSKWAAVKSALKAFLSDPKSTGLGVGIQYFPIETGGFFSMTSCNVSDYAKAEVEIATLPGVASAISTSLDKHGPTGGTPTAPALKGALTHAYDWHVKNPTHTVIVVLATDGQPTDCTPTDITSIASYADAAFKAKSSVATYVIGVFSDADLSSGADANVDQISKAGNGGPAFIVNTKSDVTKDFIAALEKIRGASLACEYEVPKGLGADYKKVNIAVTLGGATSVIPYVGSASKCDPAKGGWYYDVAPESGTPTKIIMCASTCKSLKSESMGKIDIQVGCKTVVM